MLHTQKIFMIHIVKMDNSTYISEVMLQGLTAGTSILIATDNDNVIDYVLQRTPGVDDVYNLFQGLFVSGQLTYRRTHANETIQGEEEYDFHINTNCLYDQDIHALAVEPNRVNLALQYGTVEIKVVCITAPNYSKKSKGVQHISSLFKKSNDFDHVWFDYSSLCHDSLQAEMVLIKKLLRVSNTSAVVIPFYNRKCETCLNVQITMLFESNNIKRVAVEDDNKSRGFFICRFGPTNKVHSLRCPGSEDRQTSLFSSMCTGIECRLGRREIVALDEFLCTDIAASERYLKCAPKLETNWMGIRKSVCDEHNFLSGSQQPTIEVMSSESETSDPSQQTISHYMQHIMEKCTQPEATQHDIRHKLFEYMEDMDTKCDEYENKSWRQTYAKLKLEEQLSDVQDMTQKYDTRFNGLQDLQQGYSSKRYGEVDEELLKSNVFEKQLSIDDLRNTLGEFDQHVKPPQDAVDCTHATLTSWQRAVSVLPALVNKLLIVADTGIGKTLAFLKMCEHITNHPAKYSLHTGSNITVIYCTPPKNRDGQFMSKQYRDMFRTLKTIQNPKKVQLEWIHKRLVRDEDQMVYFESTGAKLAGTKLAIYNITNRMLLTHIDKDEIPENCILVIDEVHNVTEKEVTKISNHKFRKIIGMTATPFTDEKNFKNLLDLFQNEQPKVSYETCFTSPVKDANSSTADITAGGSGTGRNSLKQPGADQAKDSGAGRGQAAASALITGEGRGQAEACQYEFCNIDTTSSNVKDTELKKYLEQSQIAVACVSSNNLGTFPKWSRVEKSEGIPENSLGVKVDQRVMYVDLGHQNVREFFEKESVLISKHTCGVAKTKSGRENLFVGVVAAFYLVFDAPPPQQRQAAKRSQKENRLKNRKVQHKKNFQTRRLR